MTNDELNRQPWEPTWQECGWTSDEGWEQWGRPFAKAAQRVLVEWACREETGGAELPGAIIASRIRRVRQELRNG